MGQFLSVINANSLTTVRNCSFTTSHKESNEALKKRRSLSHFLRKKRNCSLFAPKMQVKTGKRETVILFFSKKKTMEIKQRNVTGKKWKGENKLSNATHFFGSLLFLRSLSFGTPNGKDEPRLIQSCFLEGFHDLITFFGDLNARNEMKFWHFRRSFTPLDLLFTLRSFLPHWPADRLLLSQIAIRTVSITVQVRPLTDLSFN